MMDKMNYNNYEDDLRNKTEWRIITGKIRWNKRRLKQRIIIID